MNPVYKHMEQRFEKITSAATAILGNSITFVLALILVIFWLTNKEFYTQNIHAAIGDVIWGITFLSFFIIQKSFNRFTASLHIKINELVASQVTASNTVIDAEKKTELELAELSKEYAELVELTREKNEALLNKNKTDT